jgi:hypothetical protein
MRKLEGKYLGRNLREACQSSYSRVLGTKHHVKAIATINPATMGGKTLTPSRAAITPIRDGNIALPA